MKVIQSLWRQKYTVGPMILAHIILFGLISYRLIESEKLSDDEKKYLSYSELALSFVANIVVFLIMIFAFIFSLSLALRMKNYNFFTDIRGLFLILFMLILNPIVLTLLRVFKVIEKQERTLLQLTLLSTPLNLLYLIIISTGISHIVFRNK